MRRTEFSVPAIVLVLITLASQNLFAGGREALSGYGEFRFGMPEAEVRNKIKVSSEKVDSIGASKPMLLLEASESEKVAGLDFVTRFGIEDGQLALIQLDNMEPGPSEACGSRFTRLFGIIKAKYGAPDQPISNYMGIRSAKFTFEDAAQITLGGIDMSGCQILVTYQAPPEGGGF